jgi:hypothetical protein
MTVIPSCKFQPWVGDRYADGTGLAGRRVLLLGESHYPWPEGEARPDQATIDTVKHWCLGPRRARFFTVTQRAVSTALSLPAVSREEFWHSVAFYNYVQEWVGSGARQRPTDENWASGRGPLRDVVAELRPERVVVLGKELWEHMDRPDSTTTTTASNGAAMEIRVYRGGSHSALTAMVHHPSSGFEYARWIPHLEGLFAFQPPAATGE